MTIKYRSAVNYRGLGEPFLDQPLEGTVTIGQALRVMASALAGTSSKVGSTITFKGLDGTTDRIVGTFDAQNNRTSAVIDGN